MNLVRDIHGAVFEGGSAILMGRVVYADGTLVVPSDIATVVYSIEQSDPCSMSVTTPVPGHSEAALASAAVLAETLQTDDAWGEDEIGYNFRHQVDIGDAAAFPQANRSYSVRYTLTPFVGQPIVFRFLVEAI